MTGGLQSIRLIKILVLAMLCTLFSLAYDCSDVKAANLSSTPVVWGNRSDAVLGYLSRENFANSQVFIPPPPQGSMAFALDQESSQESLALQGSPRWQLAAQDADLGFPQAVDTFSAVLNRSITQKETPHLYQLMRRTMADTLASTTTVKDYYQRGRPFLSNQQPICTPDQRESLSRQWSYPSGHTATGWAWALILSEIASEHSDAILARGRDFGQSRVVCNVHWLSDVNEGRTLGAAVVAKLHSNSEFLADLGHAKDEWKAVKNKYSESHRSCKAESAA